MSTTVILFLAIAGLLSADTTGIYRGRAGQLEVPLPRIEAPVVKIDGTLNEEIWSRAAVLTDFSQYEPLEGVAAPQNTEVRVFYAPDAIYFGVTVYDSEPKRIRVTRAERDRAAMTDDFFRILLDTFNDTRQAYAFYVNAYGVQSDGLWIERGNGQTSGNTDFNPDFIWDSEAHLTDQGWSAEIRIPYVSLRFPNIESQTWGVNFGRETRRNGSKTSWAPLTTNKSNFLAQGGHFTGMHGLRVQRLVEVNPVTTGKRTGAVAAGVFEHDSYRQEFGLNARYGVTQNITLDATINPDFSQVESDADQITANERFAISLSEKRPFFLEGTEIFSTPQRLVYTRSIVDPSAGAKITGKIGALKAGFLSAYDETPLNAAIGSKALATLVRLRRDIGASSNVGVLLTDRTLTESAGFNRVAAIDAKLLFGSRYTLTTQLGQSWTDRGSGETVSAPLISAELQRIGREFGYEASFTSIDADFYAHNGFIQRRGDTRAFALARRTIYRQQGSLVERYGMSAQVEGFFETDGFWRGDRPNEGEIELQPQINFKNTNQLRFIFRSGYYRFDEEQFASWRRDLGDGTLVGYAPGLELKNLLGFAFLPQLRPSPKVSIGGRVYLREVPIYAEGTRGFEVQIAPEINTWLTDGLTVQLSHAYSRLERTRDHTRFSSQDITRFKAQYQFSRAVMARAFVQFNLTERDALRDVLTGRAVVIGESASASTSRSDIGSNLLVQYEPSPGTIFYIGYGRQLQAADRTYRYSDYDPMTDGLFVKFSYLHRVGS